MKLQIVSATQGESLVVPNLPPEFCSEASTGVAEVTLSDFDDATMLNFTVSRC